MKSSIHKSLILAMLFTLFSISGIPSVSAYETTYFLHTNPADPFIFTVNTIYYEDDGFIMYQNEIYYHQVNLEANTLYLFPWEYHTDHITFNLTNDDGTLNAFYYSNQLWGSQCLIFSVNQTDTYNLTLMSDSWRAIFPFGIGFFEIQSYIPEIYSCYYYDWQSKALSIIQCPIEEGFYVTDHSMNPLYYVLWNYSTNCISYIMDFASNSILTLDPTEFTVSGTYIFASESDCADVLIPDMDPGDDDDDQVPNIWDYWWVFAIVGGIVGASIMIVKMKNKR